VTGVPADDRGLLLGDGLFETVLFKARRAVLWDRHMARLARGCAALGLPCPDTDDLAAAAARAVDEAGLGAVRAAVRLTWTAGSGGRGLQRSQSPQPRLIVSAAASPRPQAPAALLTSAVRRNAGSPAARLKTLSYLDNVLARREAVAAGADEALMLNGRGRLACASAANLFWIADGGLRTPALACGVLDGVIRAEVLAAAARLGVTVNEVEAPVSALAGAQALFLTNSLIGLRRVGSLDGRGCEEHPLLERLETALSPFF
jgi:branched-subunit amino acid aminotransferase/4-amino-4-deoxychorismate lyase